MSYAQSIARPSGLSAWLERARDDFMLLCSFMYGDEKRTRTTFSLCLMALTLSIVFQAGSAHTPLAGCSPTGKF